MGEDFYNTVLYVATPRLVATPTNTYQYLINLPIDELNQLLGLSLDDNKPLQPIKKIMAHKM